MPRKSGSLDFKGVSIGKSVALARRSRTRHRNLNAGVISKVLKRRRVSILKNGESSSLESSRRRGRKDASSNSFLLSSRKSGNAPSLATTNANGFVCGAQELEELCNVTGTARNCSDTVSHDHASSLPSGKENKQSSSIGSFGSFNGFESAIIIPKRPRGVMPRTKYKSSRNLASGIGSSSSNTNSNTGTRSKVVASQSQVFQYKRKLKELKEDSTTNISNNFIDDSKNGDATKAKRRRFCGRKGQGSYLLVNETTSSDKGSKAVGDFRYIDDDNLEQNAARMLSSRFHSKFNKLCQNRKASPEPAIESSSGLLQRNFTGLVSGTNETDRVLRPRKYNRSSLVRKRRHFYEVSSCNIDPYWVVKQRIRVFWPLDRCWYFGLVKDYDPTTKLHYVKYDDREEEWINLQNERFKLLLFPSEVANNFYPEKYTEAKKNCEKGHKKSSNDHHKRDMTETEPIISWLARSSGLEKSSALGVVKKKRKMLSFTEWKPLSIKVSNLSRSLLRRSDGINADNISGSDNRKPSVVYYRKRFRKSGSCYGRSIIEGNAGHAGIKGPVSITASTADRKLVLEELYTTIIPRVLNNITVWFGLSLNERCYTDYGFYNFLFSSSLFLLRHYNLMQLFPFIRMKINFVDKVHGPTIFLFEGCINFGVAILCLTMRKFYCHSISKKSSNEQMQFTSIRFTLTDLQNSRLKLNFVLDGFMELQYSKWTTLEYKLKQHCRKIDEMSSMDLMYDITGNQHGRYGRRVGVLAVKETVSSQNFQGRNDKSNSTPEDFAPENFSSYAVSIASRSPHFRALKIDTNALPIGNYGHCMKSSDVCLRNQVNNHSIGYDAVRKRSDNGAFVPLHRIRKSKSSYEGSGKFCSSLPEISSSPEKSGKDCFSRLNATGFQAETLKQSEEETHANGKPAYQSLSNLVLKMNDQTVLSPNAAAPWSFWRRTRHSSVSPTLISRSSRWSEDFVLSGFDNTAKKRRTQVSYPSFGSGGDICFKNRSYHRKGSPYKKFRTDVKKKSSGGKENLQTFHNSLTCDVNVLITAGDRGWREYGALVVLDSDVQRDWKLVVKVSGVAKFEHKASHVLQPGTTNRYTHAMMWKGGKDWTLEFTDRSQWSLFKIMHEECFNRNIRAASVKSIPIPGVRLIEDGDKNNPEFPFMHTSSKYYQQDGTEVDVALDPSHVLYDMDSEDEQWVSKLKCSSENVNVMCDLTDDMFEKVMDILEKISYAKQCDRLSDDELDKLIADFDQHDMIRSIHEHWHGKRQKKGMPLVRQFQMHQEFAYDKHIQRVALIGPPLWELYQKQLKAWELTLSKFHCQSDVFRGPILPEKPPEKPRLFAFCLKPRGLESPNRGSKQRSHKRVFTSHQSFITREMLGLQAAGRKLTGFSMGDVRALSALSNYESSHSSQRSELSSISSTDPAIAAVMAFNGDMPNRSHYPKFHRNFSKKNESSGVQMCVSDVNEFRLRDAAMAAQHASNIARLKREKAQWLMHKADLALHKALVAFMTADAIKASQQDLIGNG
ncbi:Histone-lysine N-methyltransferase ATX2 [Apostasia shenzhenica]|uniref:Enhancer of polycomb-like protein n=1 Tax=Apostasia shenzhenica TaxID=1088818 RepID=A0A2I0B8U2_9ASPA|nr:Histone-lysine N-methyltransferase ATX2 [Apostasia shenzhenica]